MPNKGITFPDKFTNERLDIFRCKINESHEAYKQLSGTIYKMSVEVMREDEVLVKYLLPWSTRVQSKYLSVPGDGGSDPRDPAPGPKGSSMNPLATKLDPWKGFKRSTMGEWKTDKMYLCVPGVDSMPNRKVRNLVSPDVFYCIC